jgi:hypothetical protein
MKLHEEFKLFENMWESQSKKAITESVAPDDYRVVLADYESDDFDINVEFGYQDPDGYDVEDMEYLLKPGQTKGDLVVYLSDNCGYTSIYVHDERPATAADIKRLSTSTFPTIGRGDEWHYYGDIDESKAEESKEPLTESEVSTGAESDFKKESISTILKDKPDRKAACEILNKFEFRSSGDHFFLDIQNGVITIPQSIIKNKDYKWLLSNLFHNFSKLAQKVVKLQNCLEDAYIEWR